MGTLKTCYEHSVMRVLQTSRSIFAGWTTIFSAAEEVIPRCSKKDGRGATNFLGFRYIGKLNRYNSGVIFYACVYVSSLKYT
ncbi:hypothetical protein V5799_005836 [Amblyomma americanum]|uniref:Uncharacterized protein n=1 Tax=Amblyomma americanum TaxID=6943 RepID=A0AAQ4DY43_AMBAM